MTSYQIWPATDGPAAAFTDAQFISVGMEFVLSANGWITELRYYRGDPAIGVGTDLPQGQVFRIDAAGVRTPILPAPVTFPAPVSLGWQTVVVSPAVALVPSQAYKTVVYFPNKFYTSSAGDYWNAGPGSSGITNGILTAVKASSSNEGQGTYIYGAGLTYPVNSAGSSNFWIDITVSDVDTSSDIAIADAALFADDGVLATSVLDTEGVALIDNSALSVDTVNSDSATAVDLALLGAFASADDMVSLLDQQALSAALTDAELLGVMDAATVTITTETVPQRAPGSTSTRDAARARSRDNRDNTQSMKGTP